MMESCTQSCQFRKVSPTDQSDTLNLPQVQDSAVVKTPTADQPTQEISLYEPIKHWQTRLLALKPGEPGAPLEADLLTVDLVLTTGVVIHDQQTLVVYDALSYCWGEPKLTRTISLNDTPLAITENLFWALQRLRRKPFEREGYLWVDALCINQKDVAERSMQVRNMLSIYQKAREVIVWLGENPEQWRSYLYYLTENKAVLLLPEQYTKVAQSTCSPHAVGVLGCLRELFARPWFTRVWTRQESWAAAKITVVCGGCIMTWEVLRLVAMMMNTFAQHLAGPGVDDVVDIGSLNGLGPATPLARAIVDHPPLRARMYGVSSLTNTVTDLVGVIQASSHCRCSDMRDRIYGILGMTTANAEEGSSILIRGAVAGTLETFDRVTVKLSIDYSRSPCQVFQDAVHYVLETEGSLAILLLEATYGGVLAADGKQEALPSWCPNWNIPFGMGQSRLGFRSDMILKHDSFRIDGDALRIRGRLVSTVSSVVVETTEEGGTRRYAQLQRLDNTQPRDFQAEVIGPIENGDIHVSADRCPRGIFLRKRVESGDLLSRNWSYVGWLDKAPTKWRREQTLDSPLIAKAGLRDFIIR